MSNPRLVTIPLAVGLLLALWSVTARWRDESADRTVALVVDYSEATALAAYAGQSLDETLSELATAGVTSVAVEEPTVKDLVEAGVLTVSTTSSGTRMTAPSLGGPGLAAVQRLHERFGGLRSLTGIDLQAAWSALSDAGAGLDPLAIQTVQSHHLSVTARLLNSPGSRPGDIVRGIGQAAAAGAGLLIFSGDQVLGHPEQLDDTRAALAAAELPWGRVEFSAQKGEAGLAERLLRGDDAPGYLRVHSITVAEMAKLPAGLAVERYRRAVEERGVRVCFVRLLTGASEHPVARNARFVADIREALAASGYQLGDPQPVPVRHAEPWRLGLIGALAVAGAAALLLAWLTGEFGGGRWLAATVLIALPAMALSYWQPVHAARLLALLAGLCYPILGGRWALARLADVSRPVSRWQAVGLLWGAVGCSVLGGLCVAALLIDTRFRLHHDQFLGVKLSQLGPLLAVGAMAVSGLSLPGVGWPAARARLADFWRRPVLVLHVAAAVAVLVAVVVLLIRSGNEGADVSESELRLRALLENSLGARPRFKEMLLGHPALLLAGLAAMRGRREWVPGLLLLGMVGVASTLNTFCHVHTPLGQSLLRTFHALWIGTLLGLAADWLLAWMRVWPRRDDA